MQSSPANSSSKIFLDWSADGGKARTPVPSKFQPRPRLGASDSLSELLSFARSWRGFVLRRIVKQQIASGGEHRHVALLSNGLTNAAES